MSSEHVGNLRISRRIVLAASALSLALAGCATAFPVDDPFVGGGVARSIRLDVENQNYLDATIYVIEDQGRARRVGDVVGNGNRSFQVPWEFVAAMSFRIDLLAGGTCTTSPVVVNPGDVLGLQIVPQIGTASAYCQ